MLKPAQLYKEEVEKKIIETWYDDKYRYYHGRWYNKPVIDDDETAKRSMVSIDKDGNIVGYISYTHNSSDVSNFGAINFTDDIVTFGVDLRKAVYDIFMKYRYHRFEFFCINDNPILDDYARIAYKYGGRSWVTRESAKINGEYHNETWFEILRSDYLEATKFWRMSNE